MPTGKVVDVGYADALPSESRLERFQRLAKLQPSRITVFERWAKERGVSADQTEIAQEAWNAAWGKMRFDDLWQCVKTLTVFDESFRLPSLEPRTGNVEEKFGKLMLAVSLLALEIQRDYESAESENI